MKVKLVKENVGLREALVALTEGQSIRYEDGLWYYINDEGIVCKILNYGSSLETADDDDLLNCVKGGLYDIGKLVKKRLMTFDELRKESDGSCELFCINKHRNKFVACVKNDKEVDVASPYFDCSYDLENFCKTYTRPDGSKFEVEVNDD